jgi:AraC-like DNA-binding protein
MLTDIRITEIVNTGALSSQARLLGVYPSLAEKKPYKHLSADVQERLLQAKQYIDEHLHTDLRVKDIAMVACMSEFHFFRLFKEFFKITPHRYYLQRKTEMAAKLLTTTNEPVSAISDKCGFRDLYTFSRIFKSLHQLSPSNYRKRFTQLIHSQDLLRN